MKFEDFGKKIDSFIESKVKPKVQEIKDSDYVEKKVKPAAENVLKKGSEGLAKAAEKVANTEKNTDKKDTKED